MPTSGPNNDAHLIQRLSTGDQEAFRIVFDLYWSQIYAVGLKILKSPELAKDLAQESFMKLWHNREQLREVKNLRAYLNVLSKNLAIDQLRKKVFTAENEEYLLSYFCEETTAPAENTEYRELEQLLNEAVNQLPAQMQKVFKLSRFEGLSHAEISAVMKINCVTSKSYMVRALAAIRRYLADKQYEPLMIWLFFFNLQ